MDFDKNNAGLDRIMGLFQAFVGNDNPDATFTTFRMDVAQAAKAFELTKQVLGDRALDEVHGVISGTQETGAVALMTGNSPTSPSRAELFALLLDNWPLFYGYMKAYLDVRQKGYILTFNPPSDSMAGSWFAIGPGFQSLEESAHGYGETPEAALTALEAQLANEALLGDDWTPEKRQFGRQVEWLKPERISRAESEGDLIRITGRWTQPGTRLAVKHAKTIRVDSEVDDMPFAKREIIENLWDNRERVGGNRP